MKRREAGIRWRARVSASQIFGRRSKGRPVAIVVGLTFKMDGVEVSQLGKVNFPVGGSNVRDRGVNQRT